MSCKASLDCLQHLIKWDYPGAEEALESYLMLSKVLGEKADREGRDYAVWVSRLNATSKNVVLLSSSPTQISEEVVINS